MSTLSARLFSGRIGALVRAYASVDLRGLAVLRVVLAALLVLDLRDRYRVAEVLYSNDGVLSNHFSLFRPLAPFQFSIFVGAASARETSVALAATLVIYLLFAVGYRTRLFHLLSFVCVTSLHARNLMAELPGDVPLHLWVGWSLFLPLGARLSVDATRRGVRSATGVVHTSIAVLGMLLQLSAMHLFAAVRQAGASWQDGTAIYYALRQNLWVTDLGAWFGRNLSAADLRSVSFAYRALEVLIGVLVLVPGVFARRASIVLLAAFHLGSRLLWNVGTYEWVMLGATPLLVPSRDWDAVEAWFRARGFGSKAIAEPLVAAPVFAFDESAPPFSFSPCAASRSPGIWETRASPRVSKRRPIASSPIRGCSNAGDFSRPIRRDARARSSPKRKRPAAPSGTHSPIRRAAPSR